MSIGLVLVALFLLGTAEVFADNASQTLLPMLVRRDDLAIANARLQTGSITLNQLAGPPLGAALFASGMALPFAGRPSSALRGAPGQPPPPSAHGRAPSEGATCGTRSPRASGGRHHAAVRTLVLTIFTFNITFGAAWSVLVLYSIERLGLAEVGFGLITTVAALGGLIGTISTAGSRAVSASATSCGSG